MQLDSFVFENKEGSPVHKKNSENGPRNPRQGKHRGFGNFVKTPEMFFAQVVNSLILKIQDIAISTATFSDFPVSTSVSLMKLSQISEIDTEKFSSWTLKKQEKHISPYSTGYWVRLGYPTQINLTQTT